MSCNALLKKNPLIPQALGAADMRAIRASLAAKTQPRFEIHGTWDYKWPSDSTIRVAFQKLPPETEVGGRETGQVSEAVLSAAFEQAKTAVKNAAKLWQDAVQLNGSANLQKRIPKLEWLPTDFDAPLGSQNSLTDQHRSPFTDRTLQYDVLISLQDLPVARVDPFRDPGSELEAVTFPISDLGSYARRTDYGAPTMYIGRFGHELQMPLVDYLESALGKHVILHEFGHVYGLPHVFQHPELLVPTTKRASFYRSKYEIIEITEQLLGIVLTPEQVDGHVLAIWPGSKPFSDWVDIAGTRTQHEKDGSLPSVMTMPHYGYLIDSPRYSVKVNANTRKRAWISQAGAEISLTDQDIVQVIDAYDIALLELMYG